MKIILRLIEDKILRFFVCIKKIIEIIEDLENMLEKNWKLMKVREERNGLENIEKKMVEMRKRKLK